MAKIWRVVPEQEYKRIMQLEDESSTVTESASPDAEILELLPEKYVSKASRLLSALRASKDFKWKSTGEVIYKGQEIKWANITDLLYMALRPAQ